MRKSFKLQDTTSVNNKRISSRKSPLFFQKIRLWMATHPLLEKALGIGLPITAGAAAILIPTAIHAQEKPDAGVEDVGISATLNMTTTKPVPLLENKIPRSIILKQLHDDEVIAVPLGLAKLGDALLLLAETGEKKEKGWVSRNGQELLDLAGKVGYSRDVLFGTARSFDSIYGTNFADKMIASPPITAGTAAVLAPAAIHAQESVDSGVKGGTAITLDMTKATPLPTRNLEIHLQKAEQYRLGQDGQFGNDYLATVKFPLRDNHAIIAIVSLNKVDTSKNVLVVALDGVPVGTMDINPWVNSCIEFGDLIGAKLAVKIGIDNPQDGQYLQFYVVPIFRSSTQPPRGSPLVSSAFYLNDSQHTYKQDPEFVQ